MSDAAVIRISSFALSVTLFGQNLLVPVTMESRGSSEAAIGLVVGALPLALVIGRLSSGWAIDHWGGRAFLLWGALAVAVTSPLMAWSGDASLFGLRVVQGLAVAAYTNAAVAAVADGTTPERRSAELSRWWMAWSAAAVVGPIGAGWLLVRLGPAIAFAATGALAAAAALLLPPVRTRVGRAEAPPVFRAYARSALLPGLVGLTTGLAGGAIGTWAPLHAIELGMANPGVYLTVFALGIVPGQLLLAPLADRGGHARAIIPGMLIAIIASAVLGFMHSVPGALACAFFIGFSTSGLSPILSSWAVERSRASERANAVSTSIAFRELGAFIGSAALGVALAPLGGGLTWLLIGAIVTAGLSLYLIRPDPPRAASVLAVDEPAA